MKISSISAYSFKAQNQSEQPKKLDKVKNFVSDKKNIPYVAGGALAVAAVITGIVGYKRGWFKAAKKLEQKGSELVDDIKQSNHGTKSGDVPPVKSEKADDIVKPVNAEETVIPVKNADEGLETEIKVPEVVKNTEEKPIKGLNLEMSVVDDSELLESGIAHVDVLEGTVVPDIIKQTKNYEAADISLKPLIEAVADVEEKITPMTRIKNFLREIDNKAEEQIRRLNKQYPIINNINSGYHRTKAQITEAFDKLIEDPNSGYKGSYKVIGNTIHEFREDGSKVVYIFEKGEEGGLRRISEIPAEGGKTAASIEFAPEMYWDFGNGIGIHRLIKMEFKDVNTNKIIEKISIDPEKRSFHNIEINNPATGKPVLTVSRTAEPDHLYYLAKMYDTKSGELIARVNTKTDFGIAKITDTKSKVVRIN